MPNDNLIIRCSLCIVTLVSLRHKIIWLCIFMTKICIFNSWWPSDAIRWHMSGSISVEAMAWQHQTITWTNVDSLSVRSPWHSYENIIIRFEDSNQYNKIEKCIFKIAFQCHWPNFAKSNQDEYQWYKKYIGCVSLGINKVFLTHWGWGKWTPFSRRHF